MNNEQQRIIWIDNLKVIACFFVVLGHFMQGILKAGILEDCLVVQCFLKMIYFFHVNLFFVCSGYLYQTNACINSIESWWKHICKKLIALGIPYIFFTCVTWSIKNLLGSAVNDSTDGLIESIFFKPMSPYWYLYALFLIFCVTPTVKKKKNYIFLLVISIIMMCVGMCKFICFPQVLSYIISNEIWFVIGMGFAIYMPKNSNRIYAARTCACSLIGIIVFVVISTIYYVGEINSKLIEVGLRFLSVFSIVFLVRGIFESSAVGSFWRYLSKYSFPIFLMHTIFAAGIRIVLLKIGIDLVVIHCILGVGGSFVGPVIATRILEKIKYFDFCIYPIKYLGKDE